MNKIILHHHTGLGDHFICNGLVNAISENYEIYLVCKDIYYNTVSCLYSDNFNVKPVTICNGSFTEEIEQVELIRHALGLSVYRIGFESIDHTKFDKNFYEAIGLPYSFRYSKFSLPKFNSGATSLYSKIVKKERYILVHKQSSDIENFNIQITEDNVLFVDPSFTNNMLDWTKVIINAKEIHCIPSSFYCLVDSIPDIRGKLFYHNIRKGTLINPNNEYNNNKWSIINYAEKL